MKLLNNFFAVVLLMPFVVCYERPEQDDVFQDDYGSGGYNQYESVSEDLIEEKDVAEQFIFLGEGPCRISGETRISKYVNTMSSGDVDQCADDCLDSNACKGFEFRFDGATKDCALFFMKPTHNSNAYREGGRECYQRSDGYARK